MSDFTDAQEKDYSRQITGILKEYQAEMAAKSVDPVQRITNLDNGATATDAAEDAEVKAEAAKIAAIALTATLRENNYKLAQASVGLIEGALGKDHPRRRPRPWHPQLHVQPRQQPARPAKTLTGSPQRNPGRPPRNNPPAPAGPPSRPPTPSPLTPDHSLPARRPSFPKTRRSPGQTHRSSSSIRRSPFSIRRSPFSILRSPFSILRSRLSKDRSFCHIGLIFNQPDKT